METLEGSGEDPGEACESVPSAPPPKRPRKDVVDSRTMALVRMAVHLTSSAKLKFGKHVRMYTLYACQQKVRAHDNRNTNNYCNKYTTILLWVQVLCLLCLLCFVPWGSFVSQSLHRRIVLVIDYVSTT